ncbi:Rab protein 2A [Fasciola hepatica]|uniref:Rab protein 2A n=1 Tax=Fasciola hepatica TaxID=6192 RepID=A0A4E0QXY8_FASHE|nr:Rab protein 2A [Fasciola hepatica]
MCKSRYLTAVMVYALSLDSFETVTPNDCLPMLLTYITMRHKSMARKFKLLGYRWPGKVSEYTRFLLPSSTCLWYEELRQYRPDIPCLCLANKIDGKWNNIRIIPSVVDSSVTNKTFKFPSENKMALYFVSASDGTNVVRAFDDAIRAALAYKETTCDIMDHIMEELKNMGDGGVPGRRNNV